MFARVSSFRCVRSTNGKSVKNMGVREQWQGGWSIRENSKPSVAAKCEVVKHNKEKMPDVLTLSEAREQA